MQLPFAPVPMLFLSPPDSELLAFLEEANRLVEAEPSILQAIDKDLDLHGREKKALRLADAQWSEAQRLALPTISVPTEVVDPETLRLVGGRPRTPAYVVYMLLVGRGYYGGFKTSEAMTLVAESTSLAVLFANQGLTMPKESTRSEVVNAVSVETRALIFDAQIRQIVGEKWDDMSRLLIDSTGVEGNTQWPTDSKLMVDLVSRLLRLGSRLDRFELTAIQVPQANKLLGKMGLLHKEISLGAGKPASARSRKRLYAKLLPMGRKAALLLEPYLQTTEQALSELDMLPSRRAMAVRLVQWLRSDMNNLNRVIECCEIRVMQDGKVPAAEKVVSVCDPDAALIVKGGREPIVGYKPQLCRSGEGFVIGLIVPRGNASDSSQLIPICEQAVGRTGILPTKVSTDDGYSSRQDREELKERGVNVVSISGSKGRAITPDQEWNDPDYVTARNGRSAVESLMFTIKHGFGFGRVARRGIDRVHAELLEKVLAYNFCRMAACRRADSDESQLAA